MEHHDQAADDGRSDGQMADRRRGPRRVDQIGAVAYERRRGDRRVRKPGLAALFGAILGLRDAD